MQKFQIGDKVQIVRNTNLEYPDGDRNHWSGMQGTIVAITTEALWDMEKDDFDMPFLKYYINISADPTFNNTISNVIWVSEFEIKEIKEI